MLTNITKIENKQDNLIYIDGILDGMNWLINHKIVGKINDNTIAVNYVNKRVLIFNTLFVIWNINRYMIYSYCRIRKVGIKCFLDIKKK